MTGREKRRALAAVGGDLVARDGGPAGRRAQALRRRLAGAREPAIRFEDLADVPAWLRLPAAARRQVAQRAALLSIAPALAATIDGAVLRDHAAALGEDALDWAIGLAGDLPGGGLPPVEAEALGARGLALMRAALPVPLRDLVDPGAEPIEPPAALAEACVMAAVREAARP